MKRRAILATAAALLGAPASAAQPRLVDPVVVSLSPVYESWSIGNDGIAQPSSAAGPVAIKSVQQWSVPVGAAVPIGSRWTVDATAAYAGSHVKLAGRDTALNTDHYDLNGLTDLRVRATGRLVGDNVVLTLGVAAPTGATSLDPQELNALRVVSSPALALRTPVMGLGPSGTLGVVLAREIGGWAWGIGGTYEVRGSYTPVTDVAGLGAPDFSPSNVIHLSAGTDGLIGGSGMSVTASVDFFGSNRLSTPGAVAGGVASPTLSIDTKLGPILTGSWQLRLAAPQFQELTLYAVERYRTDFHRNGESVPGSSGHYVDAGVRAAVPAGTRTAVEGALYFRYQSGLGADSSLAGAATRAGGLRLGVARRIGARLTLAPFIRGEVANLQTTGPTTSASFFAGGIALTERF